VVTGTVTLSSGELWIDKSLNIFGPGARLLTIGGNQTQRIFRVSGNDVVIAGVTLANAASSERGGAILNSGVLTVDRCTVTANKAAADTDGGGFYNEGNLTLTNSTFAENTALGRGGAIYNASSMSAQNCTFWNNSALQGGAIATSSAGAVTRISNCTVSANHALVLSGGGLFIGGGSLWLMNSLVANNTGAAAGTDLLAPSGVAGDHNLIRDVSGWRFRTGEGFSNIVSLDPKLDGAGLRNNGGPTDTIRLLPGSPAIGAGDDGFAPMVDQRGQPCVAVHDLGAFESGGPFYPAMLANISSRLRVAKGDNVLIGGFIVTGSQPKRLMVRALGPSIPVAGALADPRLEIYQGTTVLATNDNWRDAANNQEMSQSRLAPPNELEAAVLGPFNPGAYTAIVSGAGGGSGVSLVEVYDLDQTVEVKLANIATRGLVQNGDNVLIAGLIVAGFEPQKLLVRATGPSLNIPGKLLDPMLELRDANGALIQANDNWVDSPNKQAILESTIPPTNDFESAIVANLPAHGASYTAIVRGVNNTIGVAVVEVYNIP
jgi:predicted outer membrane repeat protein